MIFYKSEITRSRVGKGGLRLVGWLALGVGLVMIWSLIDGVAQIRKGYWRLSQAAAELSVKQEEKERLVEKKQEVQSEEYLERIIRDDLRMQKEGEVVIVLPKGDTTSIEKVGETTEEEGKNNIRENWRKWWGLIK